MRNFLNYIQEHKHRLATFALLFGFLVDIITFRNIDIGLAQILLAAHLFIVAFSILILALPLKEGNTTFFAKVRSWIPVLHQYSTGNLLSAFLILYSASSSLRASWPFLLLVAIAAIGNERLRLQKYRLPFHTSIFFLNLLLFSALALPILVGSISIATFLLASIVAAIVFQFFRWILRAVAKSAVEKNNRSIITSAFIVFLSLQFLYFANLMPPIPLTLTEGAFYHRVERTGNVYIAEDQNRPFFQRFFSFNGKTLKLTSREHAYFFSAISAPARLDTDVVHRWERFDENSGRWVTHNVVTFPITGGREGGYRAFSLVEVPSEARWRVSVETTRGQVIGRTYLSIERVFSPVETTPFTLD